jgi:hypothetical protein
MKKSPMVLIFVLSVAFAAHAQSVDDTLAQPNHVIGRMINASGEVTQTYEADFGYNSDDMLTSFVFSPRNLNSQLIYTNHYLTFVHTNLTSMEEQYYYTQEFVYDNGLLQMEHNVEIEYTYDNRWDEYIVYTYNDDGRISKKEQGETPGILDKRWIYEYENQGKTMIVTFSHQWGGMGGYYLSSVSSYYYDDDYLLQEIQVEKYDNGVPVPALTETTKTILSYTEEGKLETEIHQALVDSVWVNTKIHNYIYDESGAIAEQQEGVWSEELGDWDITKKVVHEFSRADMTYTVSFYKKSGDDWVWNTFNGQKVFFEPELQWQQKELNYFWPTNQIEFSMTYTGFPTYLTVDENQVQDMSIYPNPGREEVTIATRKENAVVRFYDLQGRQVVVKPFNFKTNINTSNWAKGTYLWQIWDDNQKVAGGKWVKE